MVGVQRNVTVDRYKSGVFVRVFLGLVPETFFRDPPGEETL